MSKALPAAAAAPTRSIMVRRRPVQNLVSLLDAIAEQLEPPQDGSDETKVPVRDLLDAIGRRTYGPLLVAIGLFSLSPATIVPGMTWLAAIVTLILSVQMVLGMPRPWLPRRMLDATIAREPLRRGVVAARPWAVRVDRFIRPRLCFLAFPPFVNLIALLCAAAAISTIPLGLVPFAAIAPASAVLLFGLGMTAKDGLLLSLGVVAVCVAGYVAYRVSAVLPFAAALPWLNP